MRQSLFYAQGPVSHIIKDGSTDLIGGRSESRWAESVGAGENLYRRFFYFVTKCNTLCVRNYLSTTVGITQVICWDAVAVDIITAVAGVVFMVAAIVARVKVAGIILLMMIVAMVFLVLVSLVVLSVKLAPRVSNTITVIVVGMLVEVSVFLAATLAPVFTAACAAIFLPQALIHTLTTCQRTRGFVLISGFVNRATAGKYKGKEKNAK